MSRPEGLAEPLFTISDDGRLQLREACLRRVLLADGVRDQPIITVSVTGAFRRGKSFLLNVLLRYLASSAAADGGGGDGDWLAADGAPLAGFPWRGGRRAHTRGIQVWSRPVPVTTADGRPAHLLLIDSQGAFDAVSSPAESVAVRAAAGLLSSVQVVNVTRQPQRNDLDQARLCAEYGRLWAEAAGRSAPLQRLVLLVRDWAFPADAAYGADGGRRVLYDWLRDDGDAEEEGGGGGLRGAVDQLQCYLLPPPGPLAAGGGGEFRGTAAQLAAEFSAELMQLAPWLLAGGRAAPRRADGQPLTGAGLADLCRALAAADPPPPPKGLADALAPAAARRARSAALQTYVSRLEAASEVEPLVSGGKLRSVHWAAQQEAERLLAASRHATDDNAARQLSAEIRQQYLRVRSLHRQRRGLRQAQTDAANAAQAALCWEQYEEEMTAALPGDGPAVRDRQVGVRHAAAAAAALQRYDLAVSGGAAAGAEHRQQLEQRMEQRLYTYRARNSARHQRDRAAAELAEQRRRDKQAAAETAATSARQQRDAVAAARREAAEMSRAVAVARPAAAARPDPGEDTLRAVMSVVGAAGGGRGGAGDPVLNAVRLSVEAVGSVVESAAPVIEQALRPAADVVEEAAKAIGDTFSKLFKW